MPTYPGIYRAKAAAINGDKLSAFIPQVFGDIAVTVEYFVGSVPVTASMGWVVFEGGNPEFPVWQGGGGGGGDVWVGPAAPASATELWFDTDEGASAAIGGTDVLHTGTTAPGDETIELWYDTDEQPPYDDTAWLKGTVADDSAFYVEFASEARGLMAVSGNIAAAGNALLMFRTGASAQCSLMASSGPTVTCAVGAALTGTTGTDGQLTFQTNTANNRLYIENRTGAVRGYAGEFLAMTLSPAFTVS